MAPTFRLFDSNYEWDYGAEYCLSLLNLEAADKSWEWCVAKISIDTHLTGPHNSFLERLGSYVTAGVCLQLEAMYFRRFFDTYVLKVGFAIAGISGELRLFTGGRIDFFNPWEEPQDMD